MDSAFTLSIDWLAFTVLASNPQETMKVLGGDWSRAKGGFRGYPLSWIRSDGVHGVGKLPSLYGERADARDRWLTEDEETRLFAVAVPWVREVVTFAIHTGMRRGGNSGTHMGWSKFHQSDRDCLSDRITESGGQSR